DGRTAAADTGHRRLRPAPTERPGPARPGSGARDLGDGQGSPRAGVRQHDRGRAAVRVPGPAEIAFWMQAPPPGFAGHLPINAEEGEARLRELPMAGVGA